MRGIRPPTILLQVASLAVAAVVATQLATLLIIALAPAPQPAGLTLAAATSALRGEPARTLDGRTLRRRSLDHAPFAQDPDPLADALAQSLAQSLATDLHRKPQDVHVRMERPPRPLDLRRSPPAGRRDIPVDGRRPAPDRWMQGVRIGALSDQIGFPPFSAAVRVDADRWVVIEPPRGWLAPWQQALLSSMVLSLALLSPLIWWMSQRLARPIRRFARAADRLGADPDAAPLAPQGPNELRVAIAAFNDMQAKLRDHIERRTHTVAAIAHDLRTPLTRLRFRIETMPDPLRAPAICDIEEMDALIAQAMQFAKGQFDVSHAEILDFGALVQDMASRYADTGATLSIAVEPGLKVRGDVGLLRRSLSNLMDNALAHAGSLAVRVQAEGDWVVSRIQDHGPGIPADQLERVFEPFFRLEGSRNRQTGGAGLGLSIARHAVRAHGGELTLANAPEGGLVATMSLPLAQARL